MRMPGMISERELGMENERASKDCLSLKAMVLVFSPTDVPPPQKKKKREKKTTTAK